MTNVIKDFVGHTIRPGDKVAYFHSVKDGIDRHKITVTGLTEKMVVYNEQRTGRKRYAHPHNCVVYREVKDEAES